VGGRAEPGSKLRTCLSGVTWLHLLWLVPGRQAGSSQTRVPGSPPTAMIISVLMTRA
jgi:hypothetical protein